MLAELLSLFQVEVGFIASLDHSVNAVEVEVDRTIAFLA